MGDYGLSLASNISGIQGKLQSNKIEFSTETSSTRTMQDEITDRSMNKQLQQSDKSNNNANNQNGELNRIPKSENSELHFTNVEDKRLGNPLHGLDQPSTSTAVNTSHSTTDTGLWSNSAADDSYLPGYQSLNGTVAFQQFPPAPSSIYSTGISSHMGMNLHQNTQRRAITAQHNFQNQRPQPSMLLNSNAKPFSSNWSTQQQQQQWSTHQSQPPTMASWNNMTQPGQRRSMPNMNPFLKKSNLSHQFSNQTLIAPSKFRRSTSFPGQMHQAALMKPNFEMNAIDDLQRDSVLNYQDRTNSFESMKFSAFESQLLDIMRSSGDNDMVKGKQIFGFPDRNLMLDDDSLDQTVASLTARGSPQGERLERFSRKVFVGGLPPDIDEEEITAAFRRFGPLVVDWPHKAESKSYFPPKGYCFLLFQDEMSVQALVESCIIDDEKLYWCVSSPTMKDKPVQIRPWSLSDSDFVMDGSQPLDPRKTIFVGGVPRPLRAVELAMIMDRLYGGVCYAGIDTDPELKYPKGAGRVAFSNQQSYIAAISARFVQLQHGEIDKRVEVKPYVLDDQMCDECHGARCGGKFAPFFCANVTCLQYYCEHCWAQIHSRPGREFHKPLVKEGADRPRAVPFRWC